MEDTILTILKTASKSLKSGEVAEIGGLDKKEVDKYIKGLKDSDKIFSPKRCFYSVK